MKFLFVLLVAVSFLASCKKKGISYTIEGTVTDQAFNSPGNGVLVQLYQTAAGSGELTLAQSTTTGSDGTYSFKVDREKIEHYQLSFTKMHYFPATVDFTLEDLDPKESNVYNVNVIAKSWVKLIFLNADGLGSIKITKTHGKTNCFECCSFTDYVITDQYETIMDCMNDGNTLFSYHWFIPQTPTNGEESAITAPLDTTEIVLSY